MVDLKQPKYLYRSTDFSIYQMIDNGEYVNKDSIEEGWISNSYNYELLISHGFKPCTEQDFSWLKEKHDLYYAYLSWATRSDGHGGVKGGTFEEYLEVINKKQ